MVIRGPAGVYTTDETSGPHPKIAEPSAQTIPGVGIAKPIGWQAGETPVAAQGLVVTRFADGLDHPRTLAVLPNGDVLTAQTNAPAGDRAGGGLTGLVAGILFSQAGAGGPSPNKSCCCASACQGKATQRFVMENPALDSPFGMVWRAGRLYVANHNGWCRGRSSRGRRRCRGTPKSSWTCRRPACTGRATWRSAPMASGSTSRWDRHQYCRQRPGSRSRSRRDLRI
jgi:glucose/arabinose dehydrogenase